LKLHALAAIANATISAMAIMRDARKVNRRRPDRYRCAETADPSDVAARGSRADAPPFDQPVSVSCVPLTACSPHERVEFAGSAHDDLAALLAELAGPDMRREADVPRHQSA
jgi:hypothetical protein